ncbi:hypothetical protein [Cupriavidus gilardii]|uniref:hypothetical protein n=1 Tax=Cupriavidus gilardii TaxID=82541 RepID=UPI001FD041A8|nr:hypothetical protein [Cupriavidus gilardii]
MTATATSLCLAALLALPLAAQADPWKDESGHGKWRGHHHGGDYKEEYWTATARSNASSRQRRLQGRAQVQGPRYGYYGPAPVYVEPARSMCRRASPCMAP